MSRQTILRLLDPALERRYAVQKSSRVKWMFGLIVMLVWAAASFFGWN